MNALTKEPRAETWLRAKYMTYSGDFSWRELEEAFNAGAAQEREACMYLCEAIALDPYTEQTAKDCADAIRARSRA